MIKLNDVRITFQANTVREKKALTGLNLEIEKGDFITIIGGNGAGKSTLLNTIAGEYIPTSGQIYIDNEDISTIPVHTRSSYVSRVFQDPLEGTCGELTIEENMALADRKGKSKKRQEYYKHVLSRLKLGIENRLQTSMSLLSGGQRQAVSLLMATLRPSKILLLDEHTAALDPKTADFVMELTQNIIKEMGLTALMITHSLHQALSAGNRTIMLGNGKIIYDVSGEKRSQLSVNDLLREFGSNIDNDRMLLS